jgi:hypothetical protein
MSSQNNEELPGVSVIAQNSWGVAEPNDREKRSVWIKEKFTIE